MVKIKNKKDCSGCSACYSICPVNAIEMRQDNEGFYYPIINDNCIKCGACNKVCPCLNTKVNNNKERPEVFAAWSLDYNNKLESSSGGCFFEIAKYIIGKGGVVVGAAYDKQLNVIHKIVKTEQELICLRGAKYVQSTIGNIFREIMDHIKQDKMVFFVGTPCQVAGLNSYLGYKKNDKLYTADLICHGVPSPKVYNKYLLELERKYKSKPIKMNFRDKTTGWNRYSLKVEFENGKKILDNIQENVYMRGFLQNIYLRPSCYDCKFRGFPRVADFTLGDFWRIKEKKENLDDDTGTSELIVNSVKAEALLNEMHNSIHREQIDLDFGIKVNHCLNHNVKQPENRDSFFKELDNQTLFKLSKKYFKRTSIYVLTKIRIKRMLKKIISLNSKE